MSAIFPDLLRAFITDIMLVALLCTMATPKYKNKWVYSIATALILTLNIGFNSYFYLSDNYTAVFYVDFAMLIVIGIVLKPLFSDKIMQWCFSYITMLNIYVAVVFLSYIFSDFLPSSIYGNAYLRLILFSVIVFIFHKRVSKLYRKVLDYWHIYMLPILALFLCFLGYFFGGDIEEMLVSNYVQLLLLVLLTCAVYMAIIRSLKTITEQYDMREENRKIQAEQEYLLLAANSMSQRLKLMDEASQQNNRTAHDRRHFNNMLLELLKQNNTAEAVALLKNQNQVTPKISRVYCENPLVNAAVSHYVAIAEWAGITTHIELDIPNQLTVDAAELAMVVSNLIENAILGCEKLPKNQEKCISFICCNLGRLILEMNNPCTDDTALDEEGYPITHQEGHGIGSKSVLAFSKKYDGELIYKIENGNFRVRLIL